MTHEELLEVIQDERDDDGSDKIGRTGDSRFDLPIRLVREGVVSRCARPREA